LPAPSKIFKKILEGAGVGKKFSGQAWFSEKNKTLSTAQQLFPLSR
jgi:hypothetical protein